MPRIKEYDAKTRLLTDDKGINAWETAGRRIGPLYNLAAGDIKDIARYANNPLRNLEDMAEPPKKTKAAASTGSAGNRTTAAKGTSKDDDEDEFIKVAPKRTTTGTIASLKIKGDTNSGWVEPQNVASVNNSRYMASGDTVTSLTGAAKSVVKKGEATETGPDYTTWNKSEAKRQAAADKAADAANEATYEAWDKTAAAKKADRAAVKTDIVNEEGITGVVDKTLGTSTTTTKTSSAWDWVDSINNSLGTDYITSGAIFKEETEGRE